MSVLSDALKNLKPWKPMALYLVNDAIDRAQSTLRLMSQTKVEEAKRVLIDKFDHNRNIPGVIRKLAKKEILRIKAETINQLIDKLQEKYLR